MKKIFIIIIFASLLFSCTKEDFKYSCDPEVDKYVSENIDVLKSVSLNELSTYNNQLQKAVYRTFSMEKRYQVWLDKLNVLVDDDSFSLEEKQHITNLIDQLSLELFDTPDTTVYITFISFYDKWKLEANLKYGWDKSMIIFVTSSLSLYYSDFVTNFIITSTAELEASASDDCYCSRTAEDCPVICGGGGCSLVSGCGIFWLQDCDGVCISQE